MQIKVFYSLVEALNLIIVPKFLPVKVINSADNLTIESHLSVKAKEKLGMGPWIFKMCIAL